MNKHRKKFKQNSYSNIVEFCSIFFPKKRVFWGRTRRIESALSEKMPVLGMKAKQRERFIRKTACFGDKRETAWALYPKNPPFWGQTRSSESTLSEKMPVLGMKAKQREHFIRKRCLFWGQTWNSVSTLSEKHSVLGTNAKHWERFIRKTACFGDKRETAWTLYPKNCLFWG